MVGRLGAGGSGGYTLYPVDIVRANQLSDGWCVPANSALVFTEYCNSGPRGKGNFAVVLVKITLH